jgi:UDP-N-acetylmuramoyl-tripeptide--D-alanyl-D-alanine ligase
VTYIDDSYNANPDSMIAALDAFAATPCEGKHVAVLGDMFELGARGDELHKEVFDFAATLGLDAVYAVGEASSKCRCDAAFKNVDDAKEAVFKLLKPGDAVLLKASHSMGLGRILD